MTLLAASEFLARLREGQRYVADGAMGSVLIRQGIGAAEVLAANRTHGALIQDFHRRYLAAGAEILTANTFGVITGLDWASLIQAGVAHAYDIASADSRPRFVWVSFFPESLVSGYRELYALAGDHAQWRRSILLETGTSLQQTLYGIEAALLLKPELLAVTCHFCADGRMPDGTMPAAAAEALHGAGAQIVGANCGESPQLFVNIARSMRDAVSCPLLFQPSAGLPTRDDAGTWSYPVTPDAFAPLAQGLFTAGVQIVGGCCGTSFSHIAAVRALL